MKVAINLDDIWDAMREAVKNAVESGRNWHMVVVNTDGRCVVREDTSDGVWQSEYFAKETPHPVTVWKVRGEQYADYDMSDLDNWKPRDEFKGYGGVDELIRRLESAGYEVE